MSNKLNKLPYLGTLEEELKKVPSVKLSDVRILQEWCEKQAHLPSIPEVLFIFFLHSNYNSLEAAKNTVENFYTMRTHIPEFFANRDPLGQKDLRLAMNVALVTKLLGETKEGYKIVFTRFMDADPSHYFFLETCKFFFMIADLYIMKTGACDGIVFVGDATGVTIGHAGRLNPSGLKKLLVYVQEAIPVRLKQIHFINTPPAMDIILNMAKPFMKKELANMIRFHPKQNTLEEVMSLKLLPNELGGCGGSLSELHALQIKEIDEMRDWFMEDEMLYRVDESKRVGKSKTAGDLFGVDGSFKKLDID